MAKSKDENKGKVVALYSPDEAPRELRKAVEAIHVSGRLGLLQKKIINNLVYHAYNELPTAEVHQVPISKLSMDVGFDSKNTAFLKQALRSLISTSIEFNVLKNGSEVWRNSAMLAEAEISNGVISYSFPPSLRKQLHNPKVFSLINLHIQKRFNSGYAYSLYENTHRFKGTGSTGFIEVETWKRLLGVDPESGTYKDYKQFNAQILKPATEEVNRVTDIEISPEYKTMGKKVMAIKFNVVVKESSFIFPTDDQLKVSILHRMLELGITEKVAQGYISKHPLDYVDGNLTVVEEKIKAGQGKIKNYPAYFKKAMEEDWRPVVAPIDKENDRLRREAEERQQQVQQQEEELARLKKQRVTDARQYFESLDPEAKNEAEVRFAAYASMHNSILYKAYRDNGLNGTKMVRNSFDSWFADEMEKGAASEGA